MSLLKINKRPKDDSEETKDEDDELRKWFDETLKLPQYYELFKKAGYEDMDYLYHFDFDNGDQELIEIGIKKKVHRRMILSKIMKQTGHKDGDKVKNESNDDKVGKYGNIYNKNNNRKESDDLWRWFNETLGLPQYYELFKEAGCEGMDYLNFFNFDNGEEELIKIGVQKPFHRRMILSKISTRPRDNVHDELRNLFDIKLELPQYYDLFRNAGYENIKYLYQFDFENENQDLIDIGIKKKIHRRMILSEIKEICAGKIDHYSYGNTMDIIQDLSDKRKAELFEAPRKLLYGRIINIKTKEIKATQYALFELKDLDDEKNKWDISDFVTPKSGKKTDVYTSFSSLEQAMAKGSYMKGSVCRQSFDLYLYLFYIHEWHLRFAHFSHSKKLPCMDIYIIFNHNFV